MRFSSTAKRDGEPPAGFRMLLELLSQCGAKAQRRTRGWEIPGSKLAWAICFFPLGKKMNRHCYVAQFAGNAHWAEPSPLFGYRARPSLLNCENEYLVLALVEGTAAQAVVGSIVWAFRRLKKPKSREMSARSYALHSVRLQLFLFLSYLNCASREYQLKFLILMPAFIRFRMKVAAIT